jgi:hypothetical protein
MPYAIQEIKSDAGTTVDTTILGVKISRTGEYDVALKGYIPMIYRYSQLLAPDVRYRILHLLNKNGPHDPADDKYTILNIPETENHRLNIESSRYLTNQLLAKQSTDPNFNNSANGMDSFILDMLQPFLKTDFIEYNARPYQRYSFVAIQNLYDYAENSNVKVAAKMVLDYISTKVAVSSSDGRRDPPYRRKVSYNTDDLLHPNSDPLKDYFFIYTAPTLVMDEMFTPNTIKRSATQEMVLAAATSYQPPNLVLDLMINESHRSFFQRFRHAGVEIYSAEPDFLITAGGIPSRNAYLITVCVNILCNSYGKGDDIGIVEPTSLMPTGQFTSIQQMIRLEPPTGLDVLSSKSFSDICVGPDFACGYSLIIPALYKPPDKPTCWSESGNWTFIDFSSDQCKTANREFGFDVAAFGANQSFGFFEAVPKSKLNGVNLSEFEKITLNNNIHNNYNVNRENKYTGWGGNEIRIDLTITSLSSRDPIVKTGISSIDNLPSSKKPANWPLAEGTILNSDGHTGLIYITNPATGEKLVLDFRNVSNPIET